jgi:sugar transferase (PEP-CTERM/EpsH1 system associated)
MRILFIAPQFPYPPIRGDNLRSYHFLRLLNLRHNITLVTPISGPLDEKAQDTIAQLCERFIAVPISQRKAIMNLSRSPFTYLPLQVLYFCPSGLEKAVRELVNKETFDLIHVHLARMAPAVTEINRIAKVLDFTDALSLNMQRRSELERWPLKWIFKRESDRMSLYEQELIFLFEQQIVSSLVDKAAIGAHKSIHVVPNGVNIEEFPYNEKGRENKIIVFIGRMSYFPNASAAIYFANHVFPIIRREEPEARFLIVGDNPPHRIQSLSRFPGIEVTGYVPDVWDYLTKSSVAVAPMQAGTGIQNKVLEAMSSGTPVVATPYALGGIDAHNGDNLLVAWDAKGLANHVIQLLNDSTLRNHLARNARKLIEQKFTWERAVRMLEEVYQLAVEHG